MSALSILAPHRLSRLFAADARNVWRDPTLVFATLLSVFPSIAFALFRTPMDRAALSSFGIEAFSLYVAPVALCVPAFLIGWVGGFLFLEDRDEGTLAAVEVTPPGKVGFVVYRVGATMLIAAAVALLGARLIVPDAGPSMTAVLIALGALQAAGGAFVLPAVARNKVEGLAVTKLTNILSIAPLLAAIPSELRYLGGVLPTFWIGELLGLSGERALPLVMLAVIALAIHILSAALLFRLMASRTG
jgi:fluoroquinolone transport system permease protein